MTSSQIEIRATFKITSWSPSTDILRTISNTSRLKRKLTLLAFKAESLALVIIESWYTNHGLEPGVSPFIFSSFLWLQVLESRAIAGEVLCTHSLLYNAACALQCGRHRLRLPASLLSARTHLCSEFDSLALNRRALRRATERLIDGEI